MHFDGVMKPTRVCGGLRQLKLRSASERRGTLPRRPVVPLAGIQPLPPTLSEMSEAPNEPG